MQFKAVVRLSACKPTYLRGEIKTFRHLNFKPLKPVTHIILDFGGILINLDTAATFSAFAITLGEHYAATWHELTARGIFDDFETGAISEEAFLAAFAERPNMTAARAKAYWNRMLLDLPMHRLAYVQELRRERPVYLLSNTNITHIDCVESRLREEEGVTAFRETFFDRGYYSYEMGMRKPNADIFEEVLRDQGLEAATTLFVDDNADNVATAAALGMQTIHHVANTEIAPVLDAYLGR